MANKFGRIDYSGTSFEEQTFYKNQLLTSSSVGTNQVFGLKDDKTSPDGVLSVSGSHWAFVHNMFYLSGSSKVLETMPADSEKFNSIYHNFNQHNDLKPFYKNKFYDTASVFYIPQQTFGERIKPLSFTLTARTGSNTNTTKEIIIKDDGNGNLYSTNAHFSQSGAHGSASKENYVGNLFYDLGVAVLTETASWSGSVSYMDINNKDTSGVVNDYRYWDMKFNSTTPIFTTQYSIKIPAGQFNKTMNATTKLYGGGDYIPSGSSIAVVSNQRTELDTGSFSPYFTQIHLYRNQNEEPLLTANLPRAIKMRDDIDLIITFRVDQ